MLLCDSLLAACSCVSKKDITALRYCSCAVSLFWFVYILSLFGLYIHSFLGCVRSCVLACIFISGGWNSIRILTRLPRASAQL